MNLKIIEFQLGFEPPHILEIQRQVDWANNEIAWKRRNNLYL